MTDERKDRTEAMEQLPPEELAKEIEKNKRKVARNIVFIMAAIVAFIAICIAWFVSNNRVNGTLGSISADMRSVELKTYGNAGIHDDLLKKITESEPESFWYELGDVICIGNGEHLFYCFPQGNVPVAKARLAAEELYKLHKKR